MLEEALDYLAGLVKKGQDVKILDAAGDADNITRMLVPGIDEPIAIKATPRPDYRALSLESLCTHARDHFAITQIKHPVFNDEGAQIGEKVDSRRPVVRVGEKVVILIFDERQPDEYSAYALLPSAFFTFLDGLNAEFKSFAPKELASILRRLQAFGVDVPSDLMSYVENTSFRRTSDVNTGAGKGVDTMSAAVRNEADAKVIEGSKVYGLGGLLYDCHEFTKKSHVSIYIEPDSASAQFNVCLDVSMFESAKYASLASIQAIVEAQTASEDDEKSIPVYRGNA